MTAAVCTSPIPKMSAARYIPMPSAITTTSASTSQIQQAQNKIMSPVEPQGAYSLDLIIKSGWLQKKARKTKNWKKRWFVLRGDRLQCYKDQKEYKVHRQVLLSEISACAMLKHGKRDNVFGLFSPSRNYHLQAESLKEAEEWVELIRKTADLKDTGEEYLLSPTAEGFMPNSPPGSTSRPPNPIQHMQVGSLSCHTLEYSGAEVASCSSLSDVARISQLSLSVQQDPQGAAAQNAGNAIAAPSTAATATAAATGPTDAPKPGVRRNETGISEIEGSRVIWHGYLYVLKSKGGVRQWKKIWVVLRPVNVAFYKDEEEYRATRLIPLDTVIDAVEIDPLSKSKKFCMQLITEEKSYRFAVADETQLANWLGAMKVTLAKHRKFE